MDPKIQLLLFQAAGLLTMIADGHVVPNLREQARELLEQIGAVLAQEV